MLAVVILLLFSFVHIAQPLPADETWYYAQRASDLVAFTPEGEQNIVMQNSAG